MSPGRCIPDPLILGLQALVHKLHVVLVPCKQLRPGRAHRVCQVAQDPNRCTGSLPRPCAHTPQQHKEKVNWAGFEVEDSEFGVQGLTFRVLASSLSAQGGGKNQVGTEPSGLSPFHSLSQSTNESERALTSPCLGRHSRWKQDVLRVAPRPRSPLFILTKVLNNSKNPLRIGLPGYSHLSLSWATFSMKARMCCA